MQKFNYHTHTYRCKHAFGADEQYIQAGIDAGLKTLGISDHAPLPNNITHHGRMNHDDFLEYLDTFKQLKEKYANQIELKIGIEAEDYLCNYPEMDEFFEKLDYVLYSIHGRSIEHPYIFAKSKTPQDILDYGNLFVEGLTKRKWLYACHPDYYFRNVNDFSKECEQVAHQICKACQDNNVIMEVNLSGTYYPRVDFKQGSFLMYPNRLFWQIASQYDVKCVYGIDAHDPAILKDFYKYLEMGEKELKGINLSFIDEPLL